MNTINSTTNTINNKTIEEKEPLLNQENQEKLYPDLDNLTNSPENLEPTDNKENTKTTEPTDNKETTKTTEPSETSELIDYNKINKSVYKNCIYVFPFIIFLIVIISILKFKT